MRLDIPNNEVYMEEPVGKQPKYWFLSYGKRYLFKKAGYKQDETPIYNDVSECLASDVANLLGLDHATYYLCRSNGEDGVITPDFLNNEINKPKCEEFYDGVYLISQIDPGFKNKSLINPVTHQYYTADLVIRSIYKYGLLNDALNMFVYDCLIANRDRNPSNYGIIVNHKDNTIRFAPLFDNATSFGISMVSHRLAKCIAQDGHIVDNEHLNLVIHKQLTGKVTLDRHLQYSEKAKWDREEEKRILGLIENKRLELKTLLEQNLISLDEYHKTLSSIGNEYRKFNIVDLRYQLMISYLTLFYSKEIEPLMNKIEEKITKENIDKIFDAYKDYLPIDRLNIAKQVILERANWMTSFYRQNKKKSEGKLLC